MGIFLGTVALIIIACVWANYDYNQKKDEAQRQQQIREEKSKKRDNDIELVKQFAKNHNSNIDSLLKERNDLLTSAMRNYATGKLTTPLRPSTVRPVYRGNAVGEYVADKMNKEREENYRSSLSSCNDLISKGLEYRQKCKKTENEILEKLKRIPESEEYVKVLQMYFAEDDKVFNV